MPCTFGKGVLISVEGFENLVKYFQIIPCCQNTVLPFKMKDVMYCTASLLTETKNTENNFAMKLKTSDVNIDCKTLHAERLKQNYDGSPEKKAKLE